jgi:opacity protein-like surface antigen
MKSFSFVATALLGAGGLALIAAPAMAQPDNGTVDWSGVYVGLNAGWNNAATQVHPSSATTNQLTGLSNGAGTVNVPAATFPTSQMDFSDSSWTGGGQVGINRQRGHLVYGVEGDMDAVGGHGSQFSSYALPATGLTTDSGVAIERRTDPNWTASIRGRLGWASGPFLFYGTGGVAFADVRQSALYGYAPTAATGVAAANPGADLGPFVNGASTDNTLVGWTVGGGAEYAINRQISVGAEYRHSDYGTQTFGFVNPGAGATSENVPVHFADDQVLAKVNFKFGPGMF